MSTVNGDVEDQFSVSEAQVTVRRRPVGHILRCVVLFTGIFAQFLLVNCIPRAKAINSLPDDPRIDEYRKGLWMSAVGSGFVQACALVLIVIVCIGVRSSANLKAAGLGALVFYTLGTLLNTIGFGICTHQSWDWDLKYADGRTIMSKDSYRSQMVGQLMGEAFTTAAGLLMLLPDFGVLKDWSDREKVFSGRPLGHIMRQVLVLMGVFFHFLLAACVPRAGTINRLPDKHFYEDYEDDLYLTAVGAGIVQGCALLLLCIVLWGMDNMILKGAGFAMLVLYVFGTILNTVGMWKAANDTWDWHWELQSQSAARSGYIGIIVSELCYAIVGLQILLPDFGVLNNWEQSDE